MDNFDQDYNSDLLDAMADRAYELEQAMREADQAEWSYVDRSNGIVSIDIIEQQVDQSEFMTMESIIQEMEDYYDDQT